VVGRQAGNLEYALRVPPCLSHADLFVLDISPACREDTVCSCTESWSRSASCRESCSWASTTTPAAFAVGALDYGFKAQLAADLLLSLEAALRHQEFASPTPAFTEFRRSRGIHESI